MHTRRNFMIQSSTLAMGTLLLPSVSLASDSKRGYGVQLYTFRKEMDQDPIGTLKQIAALGIKEIESARSNKGHYYGLKPKEMQSVCNDLGMVLKSGHVALDRNWEGTMAEAKEAGQEYVICSSLPTKGQTIKNYLKVAETFNKAGEDCKKMGLKFGYHNHEYEFESTENTVLYDLLLLHTDPDLVHMELDLGWTIAAGKDPLDYFRDFPGRFPLWHLKDMDLDHKESTEFGKGALDIKTMLDQIEASGAKHIFIEQEEYTTNAIKSMEHNMEYLANLK